MRCVIKALCGPVALSLSGCYLDIDFVGSGQVQSTDGHVNCTADCRDSRIGVFTRYLEAEPAAGFSFVGFLATHKDGSHTAAADESKACT